MKFWDEFGEFLKGLKVLSTLNDGILEVKIPKIKPTKGLISPIE